MPIKAGVGFTLTLALWLGTSAWAAVDVAEFKQAVDQENIQLVLQWLINDVEQESALKNLLPALNRLKTQLSATIPATPQKLNYEALILASLRPESAQTEKLRHLIRHSVDYLNLKPGPEVLALEAMPLKVLPKSPPTFTLKQGFPEPLAKLHPQTPHTIVGLADYNRRRLGKVPMEYALKGNWPLYLFDCDAPIALTHLQQLGFRQFYRVQPFYSNWGKDIFLAQRNLETVLVYTGIFGTMMEDHLLYMLKTSESKGVPFKPSQITRFYSNGMTTKARMLNLYQQDLKTVLGPNTILMMGYYHILGQALVAKQKAWQQCQAQKSSLALYQIQTESCPPCPHCAPLGNIIETLPGQALLLQRFRLRDHLGKEWQLVHVGANHSLYGDMTRELIRLALQQGIHEIVFAGSAGAVKADLPIYSWVVPQHIQDYQGHEYAVPNHFLGYSSVMMPQEKTHLTFGTIHHGAVSPVAETQNKVQEWLQGGVATVDIEVGEIAKEIHQWPGTSLSVALLVTDFPGAFLQKQTHHLDQVNYRQKYTVIPTLLNMVLQRYQIQTILPVEHP